MLHESINCIFLQAFLYNTSVFCVISSIIAEPLIYLKKYKNDKNFWWFFMHCQKPKRRTPVYSGRSTTQDKSQRSRSMSFSPERVRVRGRSPAFTALAANFESSSNRNLSTPPPVVKKLYPKSLTPDSSNNKSSTIAALVGSSDRPTQTLTPESAKGMWYNYSGKNSAWK